MADEYVPFDFSDSGRQLREFERFAQFWLGSRAQHFGVRTAELEQFAMPDPLRWFFGFAGGWPHPWTLTDPPVVARSLNIFSSRDNLVVPTLDSFEEGLVVFGAAEHGYCRWATVAERVEDGPVFGDSGEQPVLSPNWDQYAESLQEFLLRLLLRSCVALHTVSWASVDARDRGNDHTRHLLRTADWIYDVRWADWAGEEPLHLTYDDQGAGDWVLIYQAEGSQNPTLGVRSKEVARKLATYFRQSDD